MILTITLLKDSWFDEIEYNCGTIPQQPMKTVHIELNKEQESQIKQKDWHIGFTFIEPEE